MKPLRLAAFTLLIATLTFLCIQLAAAQPGPTQFGGGGYITGQVLGFNMYDQLEPVQWATVYASNGQRTFVAYSSSGGFYSMFVSPIGFYNVTVVEAGYKISSSTVAVSDGSTSSINFILEQSHVPIPEFPAGMAFVTLSVLSLAMLILRRRRWR